MRVEYLSSYDRSFQKLDPRTQTKTIKAIDRLLTYFQTGQRSLGLGLRQVRQKTWEIRIDLDTRIFFQLEKDLVTFILVGNHDDIRRTIRHH
ncbi:MAG: hypothetical protein HYZ73_03410 [Elusimicrobia bacterium]|nr:hypothetical protein [Elusimicrobiota bacterium]